MTLSALLGLAPTVAQHLALHLGKLHAYEKWLVLVLAFGPFVVLGVVVAVIRRRDAAAEDAETVESEKGEAGEDTEEREGRAGRGKPHERDGDESG